MSQLRGTAVLGVTRARAYGQHVDRDPVTQGVATAEAQNHAEEAGGWAEQCQNGLRLSVGGGALEPSAGGMGRRRSAPGKEGT